MDLSRGNEKAIGVFVSGSEIKQLGWIPKEAISEIERMGQTEDLKISHNFQGERNFHFILVKLIVSYKSPHLSCRSSASSFFYPNSWKNIDTDCKKHYSYNSGVNDNNSCHHVKPTMLTCLIKT